MDDSGPREQGAGRIAVLASGAGSTFAFLHAESRRGTLHASVCLLIVSRAESPALTVAREQSVAHLVLDETSLGHDGADEAMRDALIAHRIGVIVLAGYTRKVGRRTLAAFPQQIINVHPAPLPRFGGQGMYGDHVHRAVLESGVGHSAATVHRVDAEYDTGPVIATQQVPVIPGDSVATLRARV